MAQLRPKIVKLAKIIGGVTGITTKIDENAPEYYCMAGILSDDEADIAIAAGLRKERTAGYLAKKVGKTVEEIAPLLDNLVYYGIFRRSMDKALGEDVYYMQIFAPGILEMMVNQKELLETHPEVGRAFDEYTRNLAANMGAMIPDGYGLMRVIPVESALEGIEGVSDYERTTAFLCPRARAARRARALATAAVISRRICACRWAEVPSTTSAPAAPERSRASRRSRSFSARRKTASCTTWSTSRSRARARPSATAAPAPASVCAWV